MVKLLTYVVFDWRTCLNFRVVGSLCHLLLADEVINNPHTDWGLRVVPLHDDQWAAGFVGVRQFKPGNRVTEIYKCTTYWKMFSANWPHYCNWQLTLSFLFCQTATQLKTCSALSQTPLSTENIVIYPLMSDWLWCSLLQLYVTENILHTSFMPRNQWMAAQQID